MELSGGASLLAVSASERGGRGYGDPEVLFEEVYVEPEKQLRPITFTEWRTEKLSRPEHYARHGAIGDNC